MVRNQEVRDLEIDFSLDLNIEPIEWASWGDIQLAHFFLTERGAGLPWLNRESLRKKEVNSNSRRKREANETHEKQMVVRGPMGGDVRVDVGMDGPCPGS